MWLAAIGGDLRGGNGELAVFDVNAELLAGVEACIVDQPAAGDLEPEVQRLAALIIDGPHPVTTDVALALHGDETLRDGLPNLRRVDLAHVLV